MRAAVITRIESPWELPEVPDPTPGPGQVVLRSTPAACASATCSCTTAVAGAAADRRRARAGRRDRRRRAGVTRLRVGDRVGVSWLQKGEGRCTECQSGRPLHCAGRADLDRTSAAATRSTCSAWEAGCTLLPDAVSYRDAAVAFCAGFTTMSGLRSAKPKPGDRVAVLGVGGLGHMAVQLSRRARPGDAGDHQLRRTRRSTPSSSARPTPSWPATTRARRWPTPAARTSC